MNRLASAKRRAACAAIVLAAGAATTASAADKNWVLNGNGLWSNAFNWSPVGQPGPADTVGIGNVLGVQNSTVSLDLNESIQNLGITDGMTVDTDGHTLDVGLTISITGRNVVGLNAFPSRLVVEQIVDGPEVFAGAITATSQGEVQLQGGGLYIDSTLNIGSQSFLRGSGTVTIDSNILNLRNDGTIVAGPGPLSISQTGTGMADLDGTSGGGDLDLTAASNSSLTFNGGGVFEAFGGTLSMIRGTLLHMNLDEPWTVEATGTFDIYGSGSGSPARITGRPLNFNGTINLFGGSQFSLEADVTFGAGSELITGTNATADVAGDATINGGLFTINENSNLDFDGAAIVRGGSFITHSNQSTTGSVDFNGATEWDGNINVDGFARQNGPAHVTGATTITGGTFDMDGSNAATWDIDAPLTMNVDRIDFAGNEINTAVSIGAGRLTVILPGSDYWITAGTLNLSGNSLLFGTKIGNGSNLYIAGDVNVVGKCDISTATSVGASATISIPAASAALRFMGDVLFQSQSITYVGDGTIQNGGNSTITFATGTNTGPIGVNNAGVLRVGTNPGIMSVESFQTTGTWEVDIGGPNAGTEHDRLVVNGPATLGGTLRVEVLPGFQPSVGDEFTILNATGGITGSFAPGVTTVVGSRVYHWDVIVGSADVVLRLASIGLCYPNCDGSTTPPILNALDFNCFLQRYIAAQALPPAAQLTTYANCDGSTAAPVLNALDFACFLQRYRTGCP